MATRAQQIECLAAGVIYDGSTIVNPYAAFYAAGTTTPKDAYADINKAVAITKKALDTQGRALVYGDGIYKIRIYSGDPDNGGVLKFEIDNYKVTAVSGNARTITSDTVGTSDDGLILANTTSGNITYGLPSAANMTGRTLTIKKTAAGNILTYAATGGENIDGNVSSSLVDQNATVQLISDGVNWYGAEIVGTASTLGGFSASETAVAGTIPVYNVDADLVGDITGNAATVTNGVYTAGNQTIAGIKTFSSVIVGTINAAIASLFGTQFVAGKNSQSAASNSAIKAYSETGDVVIAFDATGDSATGLKHIRGGNGLVVINSDGSNTAPIVASQFTGPLNGNADTVTTLTTAQVLAAVAGMTVGAVGTDAMLYDTVARETAPGTARAGSELRYANTHDAGYGGAAAPSGTWKCKGHTGVVSGGVDLSTITRTSVWWRSA